MLVARDAQVGCAAQVNAEFQAVVPVQLGKIGHYLILRLDLVERAIAAVSVQSRADVEAQIARPLKLEFREAGAEVIQVQARNAQVRLGSFAEVHGQDIHFVLEIAEAHVQDGRRIEGVIETEREALVAHFGRTAESHQFTPAALPENAWAVSGEIGKAVAPEDVQIVRDAAINANVEGVVIEKLAAGRGQV